MQSRAQNLQKHNWFGIAKWAKGMPPPQIDISNAHIKSRTLVEIMLFATSHYAPLVQLDVICNYKIGIG